VETSTRTATVDAPLNNLSRAFASQSQRAPDRLASAQNVEHEAITSRDQLMHANGVPRTKVVGVDIDGVLADQVSGVLERVNARLGASYLYDDVVEWNLEFIDSDFVSEIKAAMTDPDYVQSMAVHPGAVEMLDGLRERYVVKLLTVRPLHAIDATKSWLKEHRLTYDELVPSKEVLKSEHGTDALVDDFPGNIAEFLKNASGPAILVDQPWNRAEIPSVVKAGAGRVSRAFGLREIPRLLDDALTGLHRQ
jgi:5'(3')-deoxyribonucleotidase